MRASEIERPLLRPGELFLPNAQGVVDAAVGLTAPFGKRRVTLPHPPQGALAVQLLAVIFVTAGTAGSIQLQVSNPGSDGIGLPVIMVGCGVANSRARDASQSAWADARSGGVDVAALIGDGFAGGFTFAYSLYATGYLRSP